MEQEQNTQTEQVKKSGKACFRCWLYEPLYVKCGLNYDKKSFGLCHKDQKTVDKHEICEHYRAKAHYRQDHKAMLERRLQEMIEIVAQLKQAVEEDIRENLEFKKKP